MQRINERLVNWASILEDKTRAQAEKTASMPFVEPHVALMPDAHLGKGATVGSVIPSDRAIIPAAVGVDIGCGMIAVRTQFAGEDFRQLDLRALREDVERSIPLSAGHYNRRLTDTAAERIRLLEDDAGRAGFDPDTYAGTWRRQLGSLGSGNHFIEVSVDEAGRVWLFLHSGSRGIGNKIAQHHIDVARRLCQRQSVDLPDRDLAYLVEGTEEFSAYVSELEWAQEFAARNRDEMMDRFMSCVGRAAGKTVEEQQRINCHHNYTVRERHFDQEVWLSRKGAIDASVGRWGLIPGSMGAASYVVVGKGNPMSLRSAPHGAGRNYSRSAARKRFVIGDLTERMSGIEWRRTAAFLDEHPDAYKSIDVVMKDAEDLVEIRHTLHQIVNVKGE